jgi:hypothetical protein
MEPLDDQPSGNLALVTGHAAATVAERTERGRLSPVFLDSPYSQPTQNANDRHKDE